MFDLIVRKIALKPAYDAGTSDALRKREGVLRCEASLTEFSACTRRR